MPCWSSIRHAESALADSASEPPCLQGIGGLLFENIEMGGHRWLVQGCRYVVIA